MTKSTIVAIAFLALAATANAQSTANANASVTLRVYSNLTLTKNADLDLGITTPNNSVTVPASSAAAGRFTVGGQESVPVTVTYGSSLTMNSGANSMSFAPSIIGGATAAQGSATTISSGTAVTTGGTGAYHLWLGGTATVGAAQATGTYVGTFTLSVAY